MSGFDQILPGTGRGTMRSMVEGHTRVLPTSRRPVHRACRSTPGLRPAVPLPHRGRIA